MNNTFVANIYLIFLLFAFLMLHIKLYLNFRYLKMTNNLPEDLNFIGFLKLKYLFKRVLASLPFFIKNKNETQSSNVQTIKRYIYVSLIIIWIAVFSVVCLIIK